MTTVKPYPYGITSILDGSVKLNSDVIRLALLNSSDTYSKYDTTFSIISSYEISGTGYTAFGRKVNNLVINYTDSVYISADSVIWPSLTATFRAGVIYKYVAGSPETSNLLFHIDFEQDMVMENNSFVVPWNTAGIVKLTNPIWEV